MGSQGGIEQELVERAGLPVLAGPGTIELISAAGLRGKNPLAMTGSLWSLGRGYRQSQAILRRFRPEVLFITGGYVCVPVTLAGRQMGIPIIIYLPDLEPGLAIKFLARFADRVAVTVAETARFFKPGLALATGYPVRPELLAASPVGGQDNNLPLIESSKAAARRRLGLKDNWPVLLVFGGSRGARTINRAVAEHIEAYLGVCQVIHISGLLDAAWVQTRRAELPPELQARYHVFDYLHEEMTTALLAADLVVSRAGASILGEYPIIGLPAVLIPYPYAGTHQAANASYLVRHQAAVMIDDANLNRDLKETTMNLITNRQKLEAMSQACKTLAKPDAADDLASLILKAAVTSNS